MQCFFLYFRLQNFDCICSDFSSVLGPFSNSQFDTFHLHLSYFRAIFLSNSSVHYYKHLSTCHRQTNVFSKVWMNSFLKWQMHKVTLTQAKKKYVILSQFFPSISSVHSYKHTFKCHRCTNVFSKVCKNIFFNADTCIKVTQAKKNVFILVQFFSVHFIWANDMHFEAKACSSINPSAK